MKLTYYLNRFIDHFKKAKKKEWFEKLIRNVEIAKEEDKTLAFKIKEIKEKGFLVKVSGLFAFISFNHMPWKYYDFESWKVIYSKLIDKRFYCKIYQIKKDPFSIIVNGEIPQFKKYELKIGETYTGTAIKKSRYGIYIEIGYQFDWKFGSITGLVHESQFSDKTNFLNSKIGEEFKTIYLGENENGQPIFGYDPVKADWFLDKPQQLIGQKTWAKVIHENNEPGVKFIVKGKYSGKISSLKKDYPPGNYRRKMKMAANELKHGKIINCEVIRCQKRSMTLIIKWLDYKVPNDFVDYSLKSNLKEESINKLQEIKNEIEIN